ncbi:hypothetical protein HZA85_02250 [Candidatus Uhrbacteria bacterium]|nr:hypothetical protein [Candidatus Uhrbacteria bacterium]
MSARIAVLIVLDALGVTTLEYLLDRSKKPTALPNLTRLGLRTLLNPNVHSRLVLGPDPQPGAHAVRLDQASASPDSVIGHREMCGIVDGRTYKLFPNGFDTRYIAELERRTGRETLFNQMGGGVEVIETNAAEHARTGRPIVYASKCDPLIQFAMDEAVIQINEQHRIADLALQVAIEMGIPITRAIARAFVQTPEGEYIRTANRHDAVLALPGPTLVDVLRHAGIHVISVGKPSDLVNTDYDLEYHLADPSLLDPKLDLRFVHPKQKDTNPFTIDGIVRAVRHTRTTSARGTFIFANCVDTDSLYGHTRDIEGALRCLEEFDRVLPMIEAELATDDLLLITADHGMEHRDDYGYHNREPVPLLACTVGNRQFPLQTGTGEGLTEVGLLVAQHFNCADTQRDAIVHIAA